MAFQAKRQNYYFVLVKTYWVELRLFGNGSVSTSPRTCNDGKIPSAPLAKCTARRAITAVLVYRAYVTRTNVIGDFRGVNARKF